MRVCAYSITGKDRISNIKRNSTDALMLIITENKLIVTTTFNDRYQRTNDVYLIIVPSTLYANNFHRF